MNSSRLKYSGGLWLIMFDIGLYSSWLRLMVMKKVVRFICMLVLLVFSVWLIVGSVGRYMLMVNGLMVESRFSIRVILKRWVVMFVLLLFWWVYIVVSLVSYRCLVWFMFMLMCLVLVLGFW